MSTYEQLGSLSGDLARLVSDSLNAVVMIARREGAPRTGLVLDDHRIVSVARSAEIGEKVSVDFPDGQEGEGEVVAFDATSGVGILTLPAEGPARSITSPPHREAPLRVGELTVTLALPSPDGVEARLGMVRCAGGATHLPGGRRIAQYLQTDATQYPGFLGAPVLDVEGRLAGITMASRNDGFIVPTGELLRILDALSDNPDIGMGYLGVRTESAPLPDSVATGLEGQSHGMLIIGVDSDSPAESAGLRVGDSIVSVDRRPIADLQTLADALIGTNGGEISIAVARGGDVLTLQARPTVQRMRRRHRRRR